MALAYAPAARAQSDAAAEVDIGADGDGGGEAHAVDTAVVPIEVERIVRFRALGFGQDRPFGGSIEVAALFDGNINRATRADAMGSVISDLVPPGLAPSGGIGSPPIGGTLPGFDEDALSAVGVSLRGQAYLRRQIDNDSDFLVRASGNGQIYGDSRYNDLILSLQAGPEYFSGSDRIALFGGPAWRWYAAEPYSLALGGGVSWQHPLGRGAELRIEAGAAHVDNRRDEVLDGAAYTLTAEYDRALSWRSGMGAQLVLARETARDPAYATTTAALDLHAFREFGAATLVATLGYGRLEADQALFGFPRRRVDDRFTASLAGTFRALRLGPVAPLLRLSWERNRSTVSFYDYRRLSAELGLIAAF